ncbi:MAG: rhodanese-related sulfurtransferase [bacterium]
MDMEKIILYYKFAPISDPDAVRLWQKNLCQRLSLKGRIIISKHGINGTLGGDMDNLKEYVKETKTFPSFKGTLFKWSEGAGDDFPKLSVKVRDEIVTFKAVDEIKVDENGIVGGGKHLSPQAVNDLVEKHGDEVVFFDGRNAYEAAVGKFKDAVIPDIDTTRDFKEELNDPKYDELKKKKVITYCTGGIRCEVLSVLMKNRGFEDVYQIDGGIVKYGEKYGDNGYWDGSLYVFDKRMGTKFSNKAKDIGECIHCKGKTSNFENCANKSCNKLILICQKCYSNNTCSKACERVMSLA